MKRLKIAPRYGPPRAGDVRDSLASLERAERILGYHPRVSLEEGLRHTCAWLADCANAVAGVSAASRQSD